MRISDILKYLCVKAGRPERALKKALEILGKRGYIVVSDNRSQYPDFTQSAFKEIKEELEKIGELTSWIGLSNKYVCYKFKGDK